MNSRNHMIVKRPDGSCVACYAAGTEKVREVTLKGEVVHVFEQNENDTLNAVAASNILFGTGDCTFAEEGSTSGHKVLMKLIEASHKTDTAGKNFYEVFYHACDTAKKEGYVSAGAFEQYVRDLDRAVGNFCAERIFALRLGSLLVMSKSMMDIYFE